MNNGQISKMSKSQLQVKLGLATIANEYKQRRIEELEEEVKLLTPTPRPLCVKCENAESLPSHDLCAECRITELEKQLVEKTKTALIASEKDREVISLFVNCKPPDPQKIHNTENEDKK